MNNKYAIFQVPVCTLTNKKYFTKFHDTLEEAKAETERLCRKERTTFLVLKVVGECHVEETPVKWEEEVFEYRDVVEGKTRYIKGDVADAHK